MTVTIQLWSVPKKKKNLLINDYLLFTSLKSFQELEHEEFVRVRTVHLNGKPKVLTLKQDLHYWPTWELRFDPDTAIWRRSIIKTLDRSTAWTSIPVCFRPFVWEEGSSSSSFKWLCTAPSHITLLYLVMPCPRIVKVEPSAWFQSEGRKRNRILTGSKLYTLAVEVHYLIDMS